ncbi:MAG: putative toxin-antitoxin system toxin component, PIN family [Nitrososphaerota archaeon]|nr:putative toxin-antitoxin system toxin component, PIN family [Nitrososphaerota archaeon]
MRIVLDTNVLVSAFVSKRGPSANILDTISTLEEITLVLSEEILEEFGDVMAREEVRERFGYTTAEIKGFTGAIRSVAEIVNMKSNFKVVEDPKDDIVLNAAYDGKAAYIVSGDRHLQDVKKFRGIRIVSPREFMTTITRRFGELIVSRKDIE